MSDYSITPLKRCTKCKCYFQPTRKFFYLKCDTKSGLAPVCKLCAKVYSQSPAGKEASKRHRKTDKFKQTQKRFYQSPKGRVAQKRGNQSPSKKASIKRYADKPETKKYRLEFSRKPEQKEKQRIRDSKPSRIEGRKLYAQSEAGKISIHRYKTSYKGRIGGKRTNQVRRARIKGVGGEHTVKDIEIQYKSQKGLCWWCGKSVGDNYHIDHRIPLSKGGDNSASNICISCPTCNLSKGNKLPHEWNGRLI